MIILNPILQMREQTHRSSWLSPFPSIESIWECSVEKFAPSLEGWYDFYGAGRGNHIGGRMWLSVFVVGDVKVFLFSGNELKQAFPK